jgi:predicted Zn-dependent protease
MNLMGKQAWSEMLQKEKVSSDAAMTEKVVAIAKRIAEASGAKFEWEFKLIESEQVNAFCLPGGKIGVYTGILKVAKTNAGLAAVLGHEVAHATAKHGAERVSQSLAAAGTMMAAGAAFKDSKYRNTIMAAMGVGTQFGVLLPYGRTQESEADSIGLRYMARAGYEPGESVTLWQRMAKQGGGSPPEILSTHPDPNRRAKELEKQLGKVAGDYASSNKQPTQDLL